MAYHRISQTTGDILEYAVITQVQVKEESIDRLAELFDSSNRELVAGHDEWLGATFTANRETSEVTVIARWATATGYINLRESPDFQQIMGAFAQDFAAPPVVTINEILVEM